MTRMAAATLAALLLAANATAAPQPSPGTRLTLEVTGTAQAAPDQLEATLAATASGSDPATTQAHVNDATRKALEAARAVPLVTPTLLGYDMSHDDKGTWTADSRLRLRSTDGQTLLSLLGRLQSAGLVLESLNWTLSPALRATEEADATRTALKSLTGRAADAAAALGLRVDHLEEVHLSDDSPGPRPFAVMRTFAAPSAPEAAVGVTVSASATVLLHP